MTSADPSVLSVVIPVRDEEGNIGALYEELRSLEPLLPYRLQIIIVENGSRDATWDVIRSLPGAECIRLRADGGTTMQSEALAAGFARARGALIATIDGDGQNDPRDVLRLLAVLDQTSSDAVVGRRVRRAVPWQMRIVSRVGNLLRHAMGLAPVGDAGCGLKILRQECVRDLRLEHGMHRFLIDLLFLEGWRIAEVPVSERPRIAGRSNYRWWKCFRAAKDLAQLVVHRKMQASESSRTTYVQARRPVLR